MVLVEEAYGWGDGDGGAGDGSGLAGSCGGLMSRLGEGSGAGAKPAAFDEAEDGVGVLRQNWRAALAEVYGMAQQKDIGWRGGLFELGGFVREDPAFRAIFERELERIGAAEFGRMQGEGDYGLAGGGSTFGESEEGELVIGVEGIGGGAENGHIVSRIGGDYGDLEQAGRAVGAVDEDEGLAAVAEGFKDVGGGEQVAPVVDKESVAEERVVVATGGR